MTHTDIDAHGNRMQELVISGRRIGVDDPELEGVLSAAHASKARPACLCVDGGVAMYIAHVGPRFIVKRMPNTGHLHATECASYDPPPELSGLGEVAGSAIQEDLASGATTLKLDFALKMRGGARAPVAQGTPSDTVRTDGKKLTLRGMLHYLWDQAELTRWTPGMAGKRTWGVVQRRLAVAADNKFAKGDPLSESLFLPEAWSTEHKDAIEQSRRQRLAKLRAPDPKGSRVMLIVGELKEFKEARFGARAVIRHLPEMPLQVPADLMGRIDRRFEQELALWRGNEESHMILAGTMYVDAAGYELLDAVTLMVTDSNWIPVDHRWDLELVHKLIAARRRFTKGLRYNLAADRPIASAVVSDIADGPRALFVIAPSASGEEVAKVSSLVQQSAVASWVWNAGAQEMPDLPWT